MSRCAGPGHRTGATEGFERDRLKARLPRIFQITSVQAIYAPADNPLLQGSILGEEQRKRLGKLMEKVARKGS